MKIIITAGGSGGHIYPAIAVYEQLKNINPNIEILFVGCKEGLEYDIAKNLDIDFYRVNAWSFNQGNLIWKAISIYKLIVNSIKIAIKIKRENIKAVFATGSFVTGPGILGAWLLGKKIYIHEQNVFPGIGNKYLSRFADTVFISYNESIKYFPKIKGNFVLTGNPVRKYISDLDKEKARKELNLIDKKVMITVGGSGGAITINNFAKGAFKLLDKIPNLHWIHVSGFEVEDNIDNYPKHERFETHKIIKDFPKYMAASDLIVARCGALTLAEISTIGVASILVPSPNVTNDHQTKNAKLFKNHDAAIVIKDSDLCKDDSYTLIESVLKDENLRDRLAENSRKLEIKDANINIAKYILEGIEK